MPLVSAHVDTSQFVALNQRLIALAEEESIESVANTHKRLIVGHTMAGEDAFGRTFHKYSEGHARFREEHGYPTDVKTLSMGQQRLYQPELVGGDRLTYTDDTTKKIASGQMYHPGWSYHHNFFNTSETSDKIAGNELEDLLKGKLG